MPKVIVKYCRLEVQKSFLRLQTLTIMKIYLLVLWFIFCFLRKEYTYG
ncbi:protein of unknown function [Xenorhabdus doucetiae]|uniref:Uncharacterized protein n=1 Tax=Xenorhabdus doucetiae TaxID=351671 RepID=A0A068QPR5_9GAMM|nr:protein of unknown function [Xenorhabdus doucetiae]